MFDGLGSTDRLTNASGFVTDSLMYEAFGMQRSFHSGAEDQSTAENTGGVGRLGHCQAARFSKNTVPAGNRNVAVPLINIGPVDKEGKALNVSQSYTVTFAHGAPTLAENATLGGTTFYKPADNIGKKSIPDYAAYASDFIYDIEIPGWLAGV